MRDGLRERRKAETLTKCTIGDLAGGVAIVPAAGADLKNRIYKIVINSLAAEVITITEITCTKIYVAANGQIIMDFGFEGLLQTTANTAITATSADASDCSVIVEYSID